MREPPAERAKHQKLKLSQMETDPILNNRMLPDGSINIAQDNLNKQFPEFAGFYDTIPDVPCVKVLSEVHPDSLYWRSSLGLHHQSRWPLLFIFVHFCSWYSLYDSLNSGKVPHRVMAALSFCQDAELKVTIELVQKQSNGVTVVITPLHLQPV